MNAQGRSCPVCGTPARAGARFCSRCGADLATGATPQLANVPPAPALPPGDEHPTVPRSATSEAPTVAHLTPPDTEAITLTGMQAVRQRALRQNAGTATHAGKVRSHNEDYVAKLDYSLDQSGAAEPMGLYIVADGMGGYQEGEKASRDSVRRAFQNFIEGHILEDLRTPTRKLSAEQAGAPARVEDTLRELVAEANRLIFRKRQETGSNRGTTITTLLVVGSKAAVANVGDSRTYRWRGGALEQITRDHSLVASLVAAGHLEPEAVYTHDQKGMIYRSVGEDADLTVDTFTVELWPNDRLLLCSDGLWEMVRDEGLAAALAAETTPQAVCDRLIDEANRAGGEDNISVLVVWAAPVAGS